MRRHAAKLAHTLSFDGQSWLVDLRGQAGPEDLVIDTTTQAWAKLLLTPPDRRRAADQGVEIQGPPTDVERFFELLARFPKCAG